MHKLESVLENETHKILRDFEIIRSPNADQKTRSGVNYQEENNLPFRGFCHFGIPLSKKERKRKDK